MTRPARRVLLVGFVTVRVSAELVVVLLQLLVKAVATAPGKAAASIGYPCTHRRYERREEDCKRTLPKRRD